MSQDRSSSPHQSALNNGDNDHSGPGGSEKGHTRPQIITEQVRPFNPAAPGGIVSAAKTLMDKAAALVGAKVNRPTTEETIGKNPAASSNAMHTDIAASPADTRSAAQYLRDAAEELLEVARLRGDSELPHPSDDPKTWTARMQDAWNDLQHGLEQFDAAADLEPVVANLEAKFKAEVNTDRRPYVPSELATKLVTLKNGRIAFNDLGGVGYLVLVNVVQYPTQMPSTAILESQEDTNARDIKSIQFYIDKAIEADRANEARAAAIIQADTTELVRILRRLLPLVTGTNSDAEEMRRTVRGFINSLEFGGLLKAASELSLKGKDLDAINLLIDDLSGLVQHGVAIEPALITPDGVGRAYRDRIQAAIDRLLRKSPNPPPAPKDARSSTQGRTDAPASSTRDKLIITADQAASLPPHQDRSKFAILCTNPECHQNEIEFEPAAKAESTTGLKARPAGWFCGCGYSVEAKEMAPVEPGDDLPLATFGQGSYTRHIHPRPTPTNPGPKSAA